MEWWKCNYCHYIHEGSLLEGLLCPRCRQVGAVFEPVEIEKELNEAELRYQLYRAKLEGGHPDDGNHERGK